MKKYYIICFLFLIAQYAVSQDLPRNMLHGRVINDSIQVENVVIFNTNTKTGTVTKSKGLFEIRARENDTLVFSSLLFKSKKVRLTADDIKQAQYTIKLKIFTNQLAEIVIENNKNTKPFGNTQKIVDKKYVDDEKSSPKNQVMFNTTPIPNGVDFVRVYKDILKGFRKKNSNGTDLSNSNQFINVVMNKISYSFFNTTLQLPDDEIKLFLVFCQNDDKATGITKSKSTFEIMDFLINKNKEFQQLKGEPK